MSIHFLLDLPQFVFFTGKGGVGKTSLACATAVQLADQGLKVLLVSTDPASNVGHVLGASIGNHITAIIDVPGLDALEIDPEDAATIYRERILAPVRGKLPDSVVLSIQEQLSGACTTEIAAFDEFTALMTDAKTLAHYDHIIFDTAPTGHTIRMLQLPGAWDEFIEANPEGASCLGPLAGLDKQKQQYHAAVQALSDAQKTRLVLVARAQQSSLSEVGRTSLELGKLGLPHQYLVINGLMPENMDGDGLATAIFKREQAAIATLPDILKTLPVDYFALMPLNILGVENLRRLLNGLGAEVQADTLELVSQDTYPALRSLVDEIEPSGHGLMMFMGKGGVGKTTLASAFALALAERGHDVLLTTSDPAAHLDASIADGLDKLEISRIDPVLETERYRQHILASKGKHLDAQGRAVLEEDLRSPCTEEIAVFQAFSKVIREAGNRFVVMDTAPTGHTLLLLDATGAYHREVERYQQQAGKWVTPMMRLQDPEQTKVLIVTLPETTPVLEADKLQEDLRRAGIEPWAWVVNQSLLVAQPSAKLLQFRAKQEVLLLQRVTRQHAKRYAVIATQTEEPAGLTGLRQLTLKP